MSYIKLNDQEVEIENAQEFIGKNNLSKIEIQLQSAPIKEIGVNGCQIDDVILLAMQILKSFNNNVPHEKTAQAVSYLKAALNSLAERTKEREGRGVEGTNNA